MTDKTSKGKDREANGTVLEKNVGLDRELSLLLGGVIQVMFVIGESHPVYILQPYLFHSFAIHYTIHHSSFSTLSVYYHTLFLCSILYSLL